MVRIKGYYAYARRTGRVRMTITKDIPGMILNKTMQKKTLTVRLTKDAFGKTLSLADEDEGIMLAVPIEPIEKDLKQMLENT